MDHAVLRSASKCNREDLRNAMNAAFSDYQVPMQLTPVAFDKMMLQRGFDAEASRVAILGEQICGFWFMSVRNNQAYLISSGTIPMFRARGLSTEIAYSVLDHLRAGGVSSFQTEVLENNPVAVRLYHRIGMTQARRLGCCHVSRPASGTKEDITLSRQTWSDVMAQAAAMRDWRPSWQNSDASLAALGQDVNCICATQAGQIRGYIAVIKNTSTVAQLAVAKDARRKGIGRELVNAALRDARGRPLRVINYAADDRGFVAFLQAHEIQPMVGQFELAMTL